MRNIKSQYYSLRITSYQNNLIFSFKKLYDADAGKITAAMIIKVIDKSPFDFIIEKYSHHAKTPSQHRMLLFYHPPLSPLRITDVSYSVPNS